MTRWGQRGDTTVTVFLTLFYWYATMSTKTATEPPRVAPLRRAKYVTVEEMVLAQYEIDRKRLDDELAKLRAPPEVSSSVDGEDEKYPYAWATRNNQADLHVGLLRSPLHAKHPHSRLQPPRDGFNLCVWVGMRIMCQPSVNAQLHFTLYLHPDWWENLN